MRSKTHVAWIALIVATAPLPASAGHVSATAYHSAAFYRALLLCHPPAYWAGGTMFVPLAPFLASRPVAVALRPPPPRPPALPITLRVPGRYLEMARQEPHPGPLWVKTARGFRLDDSPQP